MEMVIALTKVEIVSIKDVVLVKCGAQCVRNVGSCHWFLCFSWAPCLPWSEHGPLSALGWMFSWTVLPGWPLDVPFSVAQPFCLNPHGSPGLNHMTWLKVWRHYIASEATDVIRAGLCVHMMLRMAVGNCIRRSAVRTTWEAIKGISRGFGLGIRDFEGISRIMGNWQTCLCGGLAIENIDRGSWACKLQGRNLNLVTDLLFRGSEVKDDFITD